MKPTDIRTYAQVISWMKKKVEETDLRTFAFTHGNIHPLTVANLISGKSKTITAKTAEKLGIQPHFTDRKGWK